MNDTQRLQWEIERLKDALRKYVGCRHAMEHCNCTTEARAALYPYLAAQKEKENATPLKVVNG